MFVALSHFSMSLASALIAFHVPVEMHSPPTQSFFAGGVHNRAKGFKPLPQSDTFDSDDDGEAAVLMKGLFIT